MDSYNVYYSPTALSDLKGIYFYIAFTLKEKQTAENQVNRIREAVKRLDSFPNRNSLVDSVPNLSVQLRKKVVDNYIIFYHVDEARGEVYVVRILYSGRDIKSIMLS